MSCFFVESPAFSEKMSWFYNNPSGNPTHGGEEACLKILDVVEPFAGVASLSLLCGRRFLPDTSRTFHRDLNPFKVLGFRYASSHSKRVGGRG